MNHGDVRMGPRVLGGFTPEGRLRNGTGADCGDCGWQSRT